MPKEIIAFGIWGLWVLHCQIFFIALLSAIMPQGYWWEMAFFLLSLFVFGLNIALNYLWVVFRWFKSEDPMSDSILGLVLLAILTFVAIPTGSQLYLYFHFATEKIQNITNCPDETQKKGIFQLKNAHLLDSLTIELSFKHFSQTKGQSATSYLVNYKLTPLICDDKATNDYRYFVVYNGAEKPIKDFNLKYNAVFARYSKYKIRYPNILPNWAKKYNKNYSKNSLFLELIDLEIVKKRYEFNFWIMYGIVMAIWVSLMLIFPFGIYLKLKWFS